LIKRDRKRECDRETKEEEFNEDSIQTIMFTLGTFLLMVCLKSFLVEKWRSYVFLILNVILLAILFMSMKPNYWSSRNLESESNVEDVKNDDKLKKNACGISQEIEENKKCYKILEYVHAVILCSYISFRKINILCDMCKNTKKSLLISYVGASKLSFLQKKVHFFVQIQNV
jgi:hypothetical protein